MHLGNEFGHEETYERCEWMALSNQEETQMRRKWTFFGDRAARLHGFAIE